MGNYCIFELFFQAGLVKISWPCIDAYKNKNGTQVQYILRSWFELVVGYSTRKKECILVRLINYPIVLKL